MIAVTNSFVIVRIANKNLKTKNSF